MRDKRHNGAIPAADCLPITQATALELDYVTVTVTVTVTALGLCGTGMSQVDFPPCREGALHEQALIWTRRNVASYGNC